MCVNSSYSRFCLYPCPTLRSNKRGDKNAHVHQELTSCQGSSGVVERAQALHGVCLLVLPPWGLPGYLLAIYSLSFFNWKWLTTTTTATIIKWPEESTFEKALWKLWRKILWHDLKKWASLWWNKNGQDEIDAKIKKKNKDPSFGFIRRCTIPANCSK